MVFVLWSFFALWLYSWLTPRAFHEQATARNQMITEGQSNTVTPKKKITQDSLALMEPNLKDISYNSIDGLKAIDIDGQLIFLYPKGFSILKNSPEVIVPKSLNGFAEQLKEVMNKNPQSELHIYSQYSPSEDIYMPNLGVQRGRELRQILIASGIMGNRIVIKPQITPLEFGEDDRYNNSFSFALKPLDSLRIEAMRLKIPESRLVYPTYTIDGVLVNEDLQDFGVELKQMVAEEPELRVDVIGHTDNVGNAQDNYLKGLDHARQVRWYLIKNSGIEKSRIRARSKGETEAIAENGSKYGRELNRRIEIKFYLEHAN